MPITDTEKHPYLDGEGTRDVNKTYIDHTQGIWLRHNPHRKEIELFYDGKFICSYKNSDPKHVDQQVICALINDGVDVGKRLRSAEIKKLIG